MFQHLALRSGAAACLLACAVTAHAGGAVSSAPNAARIAHAASRHVARGPALRGADAIASSLLVSWRAASSATLECESPVAVEKEQATHHDPEFPAAFVFQSHSAKFLAVLPDRHPARRATTEPS